MRASWRDIKNRTMTSKQQARAHALAMGDLSEMELRDLHEALKMTQSPRQEGGGLRHQSPFA
jgi:hypothetical protein